MSRFSIRVQVMIVSAGFVLAILSLVGMSFVMKNNLQNSLLHAADIADGSEHLNLIKEDIEQARSDLLLFTMGNDESFEDMMSNMQEVTDQIASAPTVFLETRIPQARHPEMIDGLNLVLADINVMLPKMQELGGKSLFERKAFVDKHLVQQLKNANEATDALQEQMLSFAKANTTATTQKLERFRATLIAVSLGVVFAALALAVVFGRVLSNPIERASKSINEIAKENYDQAVSDIGRKDEIGAISRNIDKLRGRLKDAKLHAAEERRINEQRVALFDLLGKSMNDLKNGRLDQDIDAEEWQELGHGYVKLCKDYNELSKTLAELVSSMQSSADTVDRNARDLASMSSEMSRRAEVQAATLEESAAALEELSTSVQSAAARAQEADDMVVDGRRQAEQGGEVMARALDAMTSIAKSSEQITQIIGVIDDIAFQTNLLALNAGVEAARAGESGKGFSVVASEVRSLAQRASESAREIKDLVSNSSQQVDDGERLVQETSDTLKQIVASVTDVSEMVSGIASSAKEQAGGVREINAGVSELDKVTQQNAAMVGETNTASGQLSQESARLSEILQSFTGHGLDVTHEDKSNTASAWDEDAAQSNVAPDVPKLPKAVGDDTAIWKEF